MSTKGAACLSNDTRARKNRLTRAREGGFSDEYKMAAKSEMVVWVKEQ